jgi:ankyrin repeat protein
MLAAFAGKIEPCKELRYHGAQYNIRDKGGSTALHWALDSRNLELIEWMLDDGADISVTDFNDWTPLLRVGMSLLTIIVSRLILCVTDLPVCVNGK